MKRIVVCDSGLGGLNVASRFFAPESRGGTPCELCYFNAYPSPAGGFNKLASAAEQEELLQSVLEGIGLLAPDLCLIACNTLSIVYEGLARRHRPEFEVRGIAGVAVDRMEEALNADPESTLLILGTRTTVESGLYRERLLAKCFAPERIRALACPGLATLLESDPAAAEVSDRIAEYACAAEKLFPRKPRKLVLGFCCTHFGFAEPLWRKWFGERFGSGVRIVDPNGFFAAGYESEKMRYLSRIPFFPGAQESMCRYFQKNAPAVAEALAHAVPERELFAVNEQWFQRMVQ